MQAYLQHINGSFSTSFMLIGEVGNDEVEVLLQAPVTNRVVQQKLQQYRGAQLTHWSRLGEHHHLLNPGHDIIHLRYNQLTLQYGLQKPKDTSCTALLLR